MKRLFLLIALLGVFSIGCEELLPDVLKPTEKPSDNSGESPFFITNSEDNYNIDGTGGEVIVIVATDMEYSIIIPEEVQSWLSIADTRTKEHIDHCKFIVTENNSFDSRSAEVRFVSNDGEVLLTINILQRPINCPANEIWYTNSSTTEPTYPSNIDAFGVNIISNTYNEKNNYWIIKFDGEVKTIGSSAFNDCSNLISITIPYSVTTIGVSAFSGCSSLTSVTIPDGVTLIGERAFRYCSSLTEFNGKYASEDGRCLIIGGTLNSFAPAGLTEYTIPDSVTTIGVSAFSGCSSLTSVTIPDSVTSIRSNAFSGCSSLTSVTIPDSVTTIGWDAFFYCYRLTSVTIPDSVTMIGDYAFQLCISLTSVYCKATTPPAGRYGMFGGNASGRNIYVPMESVEAYKSASYWSEYADAIVGYNF